MNYARQQDKPFRMFAAFVAVVVILTLTVAAVPAQAQTYKVLYEFPINGPAPQWPGGPSRRDGMAISTAGHTKAA